jgi:hypothetical protein
VVKSANPKHWHVEDFIQTRHTLRYPQPPTLPSPTPSHPPSHPPRSVTDVWGGSIPVPVAASASGSGSGGGEAIVPAAALGGGAHPGYIAIPAGRYLLGGDVQLLNSVYPLLESAMVSTLDSRLK